MDSMIWLQVYTHKVWTAWSDFRFTHIRYGQHDLTSGLHTQGMDSMIWLQVYTHKVWTAWSDFRFTHIRYGQHDLTSGLHTYGMDSMIWLQVYTHKVWTAWSNFRFTHIRYGQHDLTSEYNTSHFLLSSGIRCLCELFKYLFWSPKTFAKSNQTWQEWPLNGFLKTRSCQPCPTL
jgi:hypothetical protein